MEPFLRESYGNPSSPHQEGETALRGMRASRKKIAALLGISDPHQIIFTSGGTESNNAAVFSAVRLFPDRRHLITSRVEHSSIRNVFKHLETEGYEVTWIGVDGSGRLRMDE